MISTLGPLEYILNTPSHHRVHHGRNPYCIDKNYAGVLIIWDRIFGTFEAEREEEKVAYGLVHPISTFNPFYIQLGHYWNMLDRAWNTKGIVNKLNVFVNGPGWRPGKPRLGDINDLPQVENPVQRYNPNIPNILSAYALFHYLALAPVYDQLMALRLQLPTFVIAIDAFLVLGSLTCIAFLLDAKSFAPYSEMCRCSAMYSLLYFYKQHVTNMHQLPSFIGSFLQYFYLSSALFWIVFMLSGISVKKYKEKHS